MAKHFASGEGIAEVTTKHGLAAVEYGRNAVEATPIGSLEEGDAGSTNAFTWYFSLEFVK